MIVQSHTHKLDMSTNLLLHWRHDDHDGEDGDEEDGDDEFDECHPRAGAQTEVKAPHPSYPPKGHLFRDMVHRISRRGEGRASKAPTSSSTWP